MAYYKQIKDGVLTAIGTGPVGVHSIEITETEYNTLLAEIQEKARLEAEAEATEADYISALAELGVSVNE